MVTGVGLDLQEFAVLRSVEQPVHISGGCAVLASALAFGPGT